VERRPGTDPLIGSAVAGARRQGTGEGAGRREPIVDGRRGSGEREETVVAGRRGSNESRRAESPGRRDERPRDARDARDASPTLRREEESETPHGLIGQTIGGRYRVRGVLGEGGMGTVYDAEHLGLSRQVAIKVLSPTQAKKRVAVKRFQQEARAAGAIGHPNICEVYDLGLLDDASPYLVMEKLVGQTLAERIGKEGGLPFDEVVDVIVQVLSGLVAAHEKGIVHRDIKPENIFLARRVGCPPIVKLLDFGVSKMMPEFQTGEDALDLTRTGMVMGTPYYMSPEQARGERNLDGRVDVYACGVVMYEALAGKRPFLAPNYNALLLAIINTLPRPLRELRPKTPPELEAIIMKAMARNRNDRFASAKHFLRELAPPVPIAEGSGRLPLPPTAEERKRAPVVGGGRSPERPLNAAVARDMVGMTDGPSATLRSRMAEGERDSRGYGDPVSRRDGQGRDNATFIESRSKHQGGRPPARAGESDDLDIPIHVTIDEEEPEDPTEIFRPGLHMLPARMSRGPSSDGAAPSGDARRDPRARRAVTSGKPSDATVDDWDTETVVKRPEVPPHVAEQDARRRRDARPFNPDETIRLDSTKDVELIDERSAPPRRR
jgi:serine/threonine protein kinase